MAPHEAEVPPDAGIAPVVDVDHPALQECLEALGGDDGAVVARRALDLAIEPVVLIAPDRRILYANAPTAALMESAGGDIVGRRCADGLGLRICATRCVLYTEGRICGRHCEVVARSGVTRRVLKHGRLLRAADGRVVGGLEQLSDVSDVVASGSGGAAAIFAAVAARTAEPIVAIDRAGRVHVVSDAAAKMLGVSASGAQGVALAELLASPALAAALEALRPGAPVEVEGLRACARGGSAVGHLSARIRELCSADGSAVGALLRLSLEDEAQDAELAPGLVGRSPLLRKLAQSIRRLAQGDATVLITGETGAGKEAVARAIHACGKRRDRPFHAINCAALTETLLESELFGHERGAFTDAIGTRRGRLELAGDGTLLLDEIGCLSHAMQAKLLRVLDQREFERVGGGRSFRLEARVLAATNSDLEAEVRAGRFRADLFYRLQTIPLEVPPLRRRREDIVPLAGYFLRQIGGPARLTAGAETALEGYAWPGNVRELKNAIQYAASMGQRAAVDVEDLPEAIRRTYRAAATGERGSEAERLKHALESTRYHRARAAESLGISRATLWRRMRLHGLG